MDAQTAELRSETLRLIRAFFYERRYLEVDPPPVARKPLPESTIELLQTELLTADEGAAPDRLFLLPSPELPIKRAIAYLDRSVYCIAPAFRNADPYDRLHEPAFWMLEWYTKGANAADSIPVCTHLLNHLVGGLGTRTQFAARPQRVVSLPELFGTHAGVTIAADTSRDDLAAAARRIGLEPPADEGWADLFYRLFVTVVEPALPTDGLIYVTDWPARIPTLAREREGAGVAERWELYVGGVELANCYSEELRPANVAAFLESEGRRKADARIPHDYDPDVAYLFDRTQSPGTIPAYSGVALGVDRLIMLLSGAQSIQGVMYSPLSDMI